MCPLKKPGVDHEAPPVDDAVGADVGQLGGLADPGDALALDQDRAVLDDAALGVHGDHVAGVLDLEARVAWGAASGPGNDEPPGVPTLGPALVHRTRPAVL